jgi:hypothetical protein
MHGRFLTRLDARVVQRGHGEPSGLWRRLIPVGIFRRAGSFFSFESGTLLPGGGYYSSSQAPR